MKILSLVMFFFGVFSFAQEKEIVKILNSELQKEIKNQFKHPLFNGDTLSIVQEFQIDANKILSVEVKRNSVYGTVIERQEVLLSKIINVGKDINIILDTQSDDVKNVVKNFYKDQNKEEFVSKSTMFFTHIRFPDKEYVGEDLIKAFAKAGFKIEKNYWYD